MKTETMTIHEALAELKMLDTRINDKILNATFAVANKNSNTKIEGQNITDYVESLNSNFQSIMDLIKRRKAIRHAMSLSNAITKVVIAGTEYTVAEAIEMKKSGCRNYSNLINMLTSQLTSANSNVKRENERLADRADQYVIGLMGSKEKTNSSDAIAVREAYVDANTYNIVSIRNIDDIIETLTNESQAFYTEVDAKISISNALTTITFEY